MVPLALKEVVVQPLQKGPLLDLISLDSFWVCQSLTSHFWYSCIEGGHIAAPENRE